MNSHQSASFISHSWAALNCCWWNFTFSSHRVALFSRPTEMQVAILPFEYKDAGSCGQWSSGASDGDGGALGRHRGRITKHPLLLRLFFSRLCCPHTRIHTNPPFVSTQTVQQTQPRLPTLLLEGRLVLDTATESKWPGSVLIALECTNCSYLPRQMRFINDGQPCQTFRIRVHGVTTESLPSTQIFYFFKEKNLLHLKIFSLFILSCVSTQKS